MLYIALEMIKLIVKIFLMYNNMSGNIDMENCIALFCIISGTNVFLYSKFILYSKTIFSTETD